MMMDLITRGKEILGDRNVLQTVWNTIGEPLFIDMLRNGNYRREIDLLNILRNWATGARPPFLSVPQRDEVVNARVIFTHQTGRVMGRTGREFGDITFTTSFYSQQTGERITYANTFQIKVDDTIADAYRELFRGRNLDQLNFYRRNLVLNIGGPYPEICDFLYYWLIGRQNPHPLVEVPLSLTWMANASPFRWPRYPLRYWDTMLRCLFLITGINVDSILNFCTPSLQKILEDISKKGVTKTQQPKATNPINDYPEKPPTEFKPPEFPISSALVIATEVKFLE
jgi:hypothetical protein